MNQCAKLRLDRLQTCMEARGDVAIQKVKGTHNLTEAEEGERPMDRWGNLNADAAANRAQQTAVPSLDQANNIVLKWKARIKEHKKLLAMLLDVSKAVPNKQQGILHEAKNPIDKPWIAKWRGTIH